MKVIMIMVSTADGNIAEDEHEQVFNWTSDEDSKHFIAKTKEIGVMLMGGSTFKAAGRKNYPGRTGFVLTNHPENYEFGENMHTVSGEPAEVLEQIAALGFAEVALTGGAKTNAQFLNAGLVDEIYLTIEPTLHGAGFRLAEGLEEDVQLKLIKSEQLNDHGTLLLHYQVINKE